MLNPTPARSSDHISGTYASFRFPDSQDVLPGNFCLTDSNILYIIIAVRAIVLAGLKKYKGVDLLWQ